MSMFAHLTMREDQSSKNYSPTRLGLEKFVMEKWHFSRGKKLFCTLRMCCLKKNSSKQQFCWQRKKRTPNSVPWQNVCIMDNMSQRSWHERPTARPRQLYSSLVMVFPLRDFHAKIDFNASFAKVAQKKQLKKKRKPAMLYANLRLVCGLSHHQKY